MSDEPDNLVLVYLRRMDANINALRDDVRELKHRQTDIARQIAGLRREQAGDAETVAHVEARLDRLGERVERIERRLDLTGDPPAP